MARTSGTATPRLIRLAHPLSFASFLKKIGAPVESRFRRAGLPAHCEDQNVFVPLKAAWAFFDSTAQDEEPLAGWHVGQFVQDHGLSQGLVRRFTHSASLYKALHHFIALIGAEASHLQLGLHERPDDVLFYTHYPDVKEWPGYHISQSYQLQVFVILVRHFAGKDWLPAEIGLESTCNPDDVEQFFPGAKILLNQPFGYIAVPRAFLHLSACDISSSDESSNHNSLTMADRFSYVEALGALLKGYLADGYPTAELAASLMGTSYRTLARRLSECGVKYSSVVDKVRFDTAKALLLDPDLRIEDVSRAVGFSETSHFSRMFRRIGGLRPQEFQTANRS